MFMITIRLFLIIETFSATFVKTLENIPIIVYNDIYSINGANLEIVNNLVSHADMLFTELVESELEPEMRPIITRLLEQKSITRPQHR